MGDSRFRAGVGRVDATPPLTAPHASWGAQVHVLPDGVEAPLWASALVVDDGTTMAAWIDLDVVIITRAESDAIREAVGAALGIPASHVRASVTHNHAGPPRASGTGRIRVRRRSTGTSRCSPSMRLVRRGPPSARCVRPASVRARERVGWQ